MPSFSRATVPAEFLDRHSAKLLIQPEPQYFHAKLWLLALAAALETPNQVGLEIPGRTFGDKGDPYQTDIEKGRLILADGVYDSAIEVVPEFGKGVGHTVLINRPSFANTTYTQAAREVPSGSTISAVPISVASEQVPLTLKRFAGPYDSTNSRVAPFGVDRFDSSVALHRPAEIVGLNLKRDFHRTIDAIVRTLFDSVAAAGIIRPTGMATDDTSMAAGSFPFSYKLLQDTEVNMDAANIPVFPTGRRVAVLHPRQCGQLAQDAQFSRLSEFHRDMNPLFNGTYWKSVGQWDIFKSTTLNSITNGGGNNITIYYAQAFGPGMVGSGLGDAPRIAYNTQDNYGETALLVWLMYAAFANLDQRFGRRMTTD